VTGKVRAKGEGDEVDDGRYEVKGRTSTDVHDSIAMKRWSQSATSRSKMMAQSTTVDEDGRWRRTIRGTEEDPMA